MPYTVSQLITRAYYTSNIVSREFETVSGLQINDGLIFLNDLLGDKRVDDGLIPYFTEHNFTTIPGQESYFIDNLIDAQTLTYFIDTVRYATRKKQRNEYFGSPRVENINSLMFEWHVERELNGATIYLYFKPDKAYPVQIWGQFGLGEVALNQDLLLTFDRFYINYLQFELAVRICAEFSRPIPSHVLQTLASYRKQISKKSAPMDLRMQKLSTLQRTTGINYAVINLSGGWLPL